MSLEERIANLETKFLAIAILSIIVGVIVIFSGILIRSWTNIAAGIVSIVVGIYLGLGTMKTETQGQIPETVKI